ncbi:MAG: c(7)-type cytochrome triheme domain-containing protein, partial [Thermodesulfobacteriota bacterium]
RNTHGDPGMNHPLKNPKYWLLLVFGALFTIMLINSHAFAVSSAFRKEFIFNRRANRLLAQEALVKRNKDIIPVEIEGFINDALAFERTFEERMYLLDHAHALAKMYSVNFGDSAALEQIRSIQDMEVAKEEAREEKRKRLLSYKRLRGSFPMMEHSAQMEELALPVVIYPHWLHQIFFKCKACHDDNFKMERGGNDITHAKISSGAQCGACHNGKISFDASIEGECVRCHMSRADIEKTAYTNTDIEALSKTAARLGTGWKTEGLTDGKLPLDSFGNIDWLTFDDEKITDPLDSIPIEGGGQETAKTRDTLIIFTSKSETMKSVPFSHKTHTSRLKCASCHPRIFADELNSNPVTMAGLATGEFCGACHGKSGSLPLLDCKRCHNIKPLEIPAGALVRE